MDDEQYIDIPDGLSVGTTKIANKYEIFTEEEVDAINNKIPELDERVGIIEDEIEEINSSLDITPVKKHHIFRTSWGVVPIQPSTTYTIKITNSEIKWDSVISINLTSEMPNGLVTSTSIKSGGGELYYKITNVTTYAIELPASNIVYTITQF